MIPLDFYIGTGASMSESWKSETRVSDNLSEVIGNHHGNHA